MYRDRRRGRRGCRRRNEVRVASFLDRPDRISEACNIPLGGDGRLVPLPYSGHQPARVLHTLDEHIDIGRARRIAARGQSPDILIDVSIIEPHGDGRLIVRPQILAPEDECLNSVFPFDGRIERASNQQDNLIRGVRL